MLGGEQHARGTAVAVSQQGGALATHGIQHRGHVIHAFLQPRDTWHPVGQPNTAVIENDQAREGCKPP
jgi:hypothetical protein